MYATYVVRLQNPFEKESLNWGKRQKLTQCSYAIKGLGYRICVTERFDLHIVMAYLECL